MDFLPRHEDMPIVFDFLKSCISTGRNYLCACPKYRAHIKSKYKFKPCLVVSGQFWRKALLDGLKPSSPAADTLKRRFRGSHLQIFPGVKKLRRSAGAAVTQIQARRGDYNKFPQVDSMWKHGNLFLNYPRKLTRSSDASQRVWIPDFDVYSSMGRTSS